jgi:hypothetical protein
VCVCVRKLYFAQQCCAMPLILCCNCVVQQESCSKKTLTVHFVMIYLQCNYADSVGERGQEREPHLLMSGSGCENPVVSPLLMTHLSARDPNVMSASDYVDSCLENLSSHYYNSFFAALIYEALVNNVLQLQDRGRGS